MLQYGPHTGKDLATIKLLLENCIKLLHNDNSSQVHEDYECYYNYYKL